MRSKVKLSRIWRFPSIWTVLHHKQVVFMDRSPSYCILFCSARYLTVVGPFTGILGCFQDIFQIFSIRERTTCHIFWPRNLFLDMIIRAKSSNIFLKFWFFTICVWRSARCCACFIVIWWNYMFKKHFDHFIKMFQFSNR